MSTPSESGPLLEFELKVTNDRRALPTVEAFLRETMLHTALDRPASAGLRELVKAVAEEAIGHAYPAGESGSILIRSEQSSDRLVITVRDYGLPQDTRKLEEALHSPDDRLRRQTLGADWAHFADEIHWIGLGSEGKALEITKWLHETEITAHPEGGDLHPFEEAPALAPAQEYEIRRMRPEEAVQVSQLIYKAYGRSYFNQDVYYPERVASLNRSGAVLSFVAVDEQGRLAGHYALVRNEEGPVAEGGQAVVDPAHRGRKLLERLKEAAIAGGRELGLAGIYADAVTVHTFTQKANIDHGARLVCANLGIAPKSETFRGIAQAQQPQRITCLMYFLWLGTPTARVVHAPQAHLEAVNRLYTHLGAPFTFAEGREPKGQGTLKVRVTASAAKAFVRAGAIGTETAAAIRHAKRELIERSRAEAVYAELPLADPATPFVAEALEAEGFSFAGITPDFSQGGDLLRLVYLTEPLAPEPIHLADDLGRWLVGYALNDRQRVLSGC